MRKKTIAILVVLSMGSGLPGAYFQAIVSEACDNYCFAPAYPTSPDLYLWVALFFIGAGLGFIAWLTLLEKQFKQRKWGWCYLTALSGLVSCSAGLLALVGASCASFIFLACDIYLLIALLVLPETPQYGKRLSQSYDPDLS